MLPGGGQIGINALHNLFLAVRQRPHLVDADWSIVITCPFLKMMMCNVVPNMAEGSVFFKTKTEKKYNDGLYGGGQDLWVISEFKFDRLVCTPPGP